MAEYNIDHLKDVVVKMVVKQATGVLLKKAPWLFSFGPVNWVVSHLLFLGVEFLVKKTILGTNLLIIELHVDGRVGEIDEILARIKEAKSVEEEDALEKELIEASGRLIRFKDHVRLRTDDS